jgi:hypothetical protein
MDVTLGAELQRQGAALHEMIGGVVPSLKAVEARPDPSGS